MEMTQPAGFEPMGACPPDEARLLLGAQGPDDVLQGGLAWGAVHELAPAGPRDHGAAAGFALSLSALALSAGNSISRTAIWVQQDFAALEAGALYGLGCTLFGFSAQRLLLVRTACAKDTLWAMEEALKAGMACVIGELAEDGKAADLTATRRLSLAAQKGGGFGFLLRHHVSAAASAAATRWSIAAVPGAGDGFGGLGRVAFRLALTKNRRGPCGEWVLQWDHHEQRFLPAPPLAVAAPVFHGPRRAGLARVV
jgi:protein ImuA